MKILKFDGASVGSIENLKQVKKIVEKETAPAIIIVPAIEVVNDKLIDVTSLAEQGDSSYLNEFQYIVDIHNHLIENVIPSSLQEKTKAEIASLHNELENIIKGIFFIKGASPKAFGTILSYAFKISAIIVSSFIDAKLEDTDKFVKISDAVADIGESAKLIREKFSKTNGLVVLPGRALDNTLGAGCNDSSYIASIFAYALKAESLEIWGTTDVFMTADPSVISKAYTIEKLSYSEATELCNFESITLEPKVLYPVYAESIPVSVRNIFKQEEKGTLISTENDPEGKTIKGIASINDTTLITLSSLGILGLSDIKSRIYTALDKACIDTIFASENSTGCSFSIGVYSDIAEEAEEVLREELEDLLEKEEITSITAQKNLAIVSVIGDNMKKSTGTAGKLFNALGRNNINVIALSQCSSETNISFVINKENLRKTLNSIHESFFLTDYQELNLFVVGTGTVGGSLLSQLHSQKELLMNQNRLKVKVIGIADVANFILNRDGIDLENYNEALKNGTPSTPDALKKALIEFNIYNCVFVDCTASAAIASIYKDLLLHNISVVAANKIAASGDYDNYMELKEIARKRGIKYLYETNVGAGLPIINTINDLIFSGDKIVKLEAVLSGTLNFIFNTISKDIPLSKAIRMAMEARFAEPDPRIDLSGKDVIRKLVILARESGIRVEQDDVEKNLFIPNDFFEGTLDDFWKKVEAFDAEFEERRKVVEAENKHWCFVAKLENGKTSVGLQAVEPSHPFYDLKGSNNLIIINTARYEDPMMIRGYGAGAAVTAAGVFADIISIANIR